MFHGKAITMKHIIFIIGSLRKNSFNRQLAKIAESMLNDRFEISYLDFENIPYMNQDLESQYSHHPLDVGNQHYAGNGELEAGRQWSTTDGMMSADSKRCIKEIREEIMRCDGIWVFTPEYNHSYPGLLKNLFDWLSRPMDISNFANPTAVQGKKITASGAGGKNKTASCREKLNELLEYIKMDVMKEPQTGIELGMEAWVKGKFKLTENQLAELKIQAEKFAEFVGLEK